MALVTIVVTYLVLRGLGEPWIRSNFLSLGVLSVVASGFIRQTFSCLCLVFVGRPPSDYLVDNFTRGLYFFCRLPVLVQFR